MLLVVIDGAKSSCHIRIRDTRENPFEVRIQAREFSEYFRPSLFRGLLELLARRRGYKVGNLFLELGYLNFYGQLIPSCAERLLLTIEDRILLFHDRDFLPERALLARQHLDLDAEGVAPASVEVNKPLMERPLSLWTMAVLFFSSVRFGIRVADLIAQFN